ncbi:MAG: DEAD/DEAH box helicase [Lactobacillus sp.]|nr:DEAD/DEAH box helicase [Lactobacillus sp.]
MEQHLMNADWLHPGNILVLKGLSKVQLLNLPHKFLADIPVDASIDEVSKLGRDDFMKLMGDGVPAQWSWLTYEEFTRIATAEWAIPLFEKCKVIVVENNLYRDSFPLMAPFKDVFKAYQVLSQHDDQALTADNEQLADKFFEFYEQITLIADQYFVKYAMIPNVDRLNINYVPMWSESDIQGVTVHVTEEVEHDEASEVDLNGSEDKFLSYLYQISQAETDVVISAHFSRDADRISDDSSRENRLKILALISMNEPTIQLIRVLPKHRPVQHLDEYRKLLLDKWGYDDFRELAIYSDPESGSHEVIKVSQSRIIGDIVEQAEVALTDQIPRDIFITAPTGAGKSVMFQLPALYLLKNHPDVRPLTLIISPLIGLMNDQVQGMVKKGITNARTINSALAPAEKQETIDQVKNGKIDLLYLSPETLQNRSDITQIIGDRRIGLLIVDEAHTVVTWGKSFRADYWYLGLYLQKLRKTQVFPIITFTATATIGGQSDMFREIRNSLNMINPIKYIGNVRRNDIVMKIKQMKNVQGRNSIDVKAAKLLVRMKSWKKNRQKALIYFPTVKLLNSVKTEIDETSSVGELTRAYYGTMTASDKENNYQDFRNGEALFMFATKAFGMGIDITDITNVYHYAPTGDVVDYVQEIGRVARNHELVPFGNAFFDYVPSSDFKYVKQLHGMSTIQEWQLKDAMKKILQLYKQNRYNRNLVTSAEDFKYILDLNDDSDQADNKLKIILLMLEKDFASDGNYNYAPFVARPKQVFGRELVFVNRTEEVQVLKSRLGEYLRSVTQLGTRSVYSVDMARYWRKYHPDESYPHFKYTVFNHDERRKHSNLKVFDRLTFASSIQVDWTDYQGLMQTNTIASHVLEQFHKYLDKHLYTGKQFTAENLASELLRSVEEIRSKTVSTTIVASLINLCDVVTSMTHSATIIRRVKESSNQFKVAPTYSNFFDTINSLRRTLNEESDNRVFNKEDQQITMFYFRDFGSEGSRAGNYDAMLAYAGFLESLGKISFQTANGSDAQIYIRINNTRRMESAVANRNYRNSVLSKIKRDYRRNVAMLEYLFKYEPVGSTEAERCKAYTTFFWNKIEAFFLGDLPVEVRNNE